MSQVQVLSLRLSREGQSALKEGIEAAVEEIAERIFARSQENLTEAKWQGHAITDTGELLSSGNLTKEGQGWLISYDASYASVIEYGLEPGVWVPANVLEAWAKRKLGANEKGVGWAIRQKIHDEGLSPRPFLSEAMYHVMNGRGLP